MASVLVAVDVVGEDNPTGLAAVAVDRETKAVVGEKAWEFEGASQGLADIFHEVDDFMKTAAGGAGAKVAIVTEGGLLHQTLVPRAAKRSSEAKKRVAAGRHWQRYNDIAREVERTCGDKCSGLLALMLTTGVEPAVCTRGLETAKALADITIALLNKGNLFKRPLAAGPKGAALKEEPEEDEAAGAAKKSKKRKREEEEAAAAAAAAEAEAAAAEEAAAAVVPSLPLLRNALFLSGVAREGVLFDDVKAAAGEVLDGFHKASAAAAGGKSPAAKASAPPKKKAKTSGKSPKQAPTATPTGHPVASIAVAATPDAAGATCTAEWASVILAHAVNRYLGDDVDTACKAPCAYTTAVVVLPHMRACLEASAVLADLGADIVLHPGAGAPPAAGGFSLPAVTPKITITTHDAWTAALDNVTGGANNSVALFVLDSDGSTVGDAVGAHCAGAAAAKVSGIYAMVIPEALGSMETAPKTVANRPTIALPMKKADEEEEDAAAAGEAYPTTQLDYEVSASHAGILDPRVVFYAYQNSLKHLAGVLFEMHTGKVAVGPTVTLLCYYILATTATPLHPLDDGSVCPQLRSFHMLLARLFLEIELLVGEPKPTKTGLVNDFARAILAMPLLPVKSEAQCKEQIKAERPNISNHHAKAVVNADEVTFTAILSTVAAHLVDTQIDGLGELWNARVLIESFPNIDVHTVKYGKKPARFLACLEGALVKRLTGIQLGVPVEQAGEAMQWQWFAKDYGLLPRLLARCKASFAGDRRQGVVYVSTVADAARAISVNVLPLCGRKNEETQKMTRAAIEEILTVLPRGTRKCLLSSLGVSIHSWNRFNNRHGNLLGPSMVHFLMSNPDAFIVAGKTVKRADPKTSPEFETNLLKHGGRVDKTDADDAGANQKTRKRGSRKDRIHNVIADKFRRKQARKNSLKSAKIQKIPGFGKKKGKYKGKGTTPHWMK